MHGAAATHCITSACGGGAWQPQRGFARDAPPTAAGCALRALCARSARLYLQVSGRLAHFRATRAAANFSRVSSPRLPCARICRAQMWTLHTGRLRHAAPVFPPWPIEVRRQPSSCTASRATAPHCAVSECSHASVRNRRRRGRAPTHPAAKPHLRSIKSLPFRATGPAATAAPPPPPPHPAPLRSSASVFSVSSLHPLIDTIGRRIACAPPGTPNPRAPRQWPRQRLAGAAAQGHGAALFAVARSHCRVNLAKRVVVVVCVSAHSGAPGGAYRPRPGDPPQLAARDVVPSLPASPRGQRAR